jgi:hypothetical protein
MPEPTMAERAREGARRWLRNCGVDPDDPAEMEATYRTVHGDHLRWLGGDSSSEIDGVTWTHFVEAVQVANGWDRIPLDWPAPTIVRVAEPFRNALPRSDGSSDG